jgi:uncharacterized membrane protein YhaH (DUF805 family)
MRLNRFLSVHGRTSRGLFCLQTILVWVALYALSAALGDLAFGGVVWIVNGGALLLMVMLCIRRLHDRNYSAWWLLVVLLPVAGALWLVFQLAFRRGIAQGNAWGDDPLMPRGDYLVVQ